jgi:4-amino-4-deoxy-L-arabinose transferase-like glycosyltransferase
MTTSTVANGRAETRTVARRPLSWQFIVFCLMALVLCAAGLYLRLHDLGVPFDRDSYDEGVYWQTLRAMSAGHALYQQTFYSQPPFFMLGVFPFFTLFGQTLVAARLGIVTLSLFGLLGALLLGKALSGRVGAIAALLLIVANPLYLAESQTLQADGPAIAFSLLAVALAYLWWERPEGTAGLCYAVLAAIALVLGILSKLNAVAALVPIGLLMMHHLWRGYRGKSEEKSGMRSLIVGVVALVVVTILIFLPFAGSFAQLWQQMVSFHNAADAVYRGQPQPHFALMQPVLISLLGLAALYGSIVALLRRDWRVVPLLAWLIVTVYLLWRQHPLFAHHLVALVAPMLALAIIGIGQINLSKRPVITISSMATGLAIVLVLIAVVGGGLASRQYLRAEHAQASAPATIKAQQVGRDLQQEMQPEQQVITDAQFLTALANRSTPPALVDTSTVHIDSGYLTSQQLIQEAKRPEVRVVLFYTGRLTTAKLTDFHTWVTQHFRLVHQYGKGKEMWVKL